jgi:2-keto-4-pentenoate hydratase
LSELSALLFEAYRQGETVAQEVLPTDLTEADAYQVQHELAALKTEVLGESEAGYKISLTSVATQHMAGTDGPAYGVLTDRNVRHSPALLDLGELNAPLVEGEIAFIVVAPLRGRPTDAEILARTRLTVALEVPTSRCQDWFPIRNLPCFIGDCAGAGAVVLGDEFAVPPETALADLRMVVSCDGEVLGEGAGTEVLGNPGNAIRWLVGKLGSFGRELRIGDVVSSGSVVTPIVARTGRFTADISRLGQAHVVFAG